MIKIDKNYNKDEYIQNVIDYDLEDVWHDILWYIRENGETDFLNINSLGELYELGLSVKDKDNKKSKGVYYTPDDVASLLSDFYLNLYKPNHCICDVCAGMGNLIINLLNHFSEEERKYLFDNKLIYLYESDTLAVRIALNRIGYLFGYENIDKIRVLNCDFLNKNVILPIDSYVISNPPYYKINEIKGTWEQTSIMKASKEYYAVFMEKCILQSKGCVFITPYSFVSGNKFKDLRLLLNNTDSKIYVFDNIPGNIFKGKKYGIFNSNTVNSTRAAISVIDTTASIGVKVTPMIRYTASERSKILNKSVLNGLLERSKYQMAEKENNAYYKCHSQYLDIFLKWKSNRGKFSDLLSENETPFCLTVPNTCRYFTSASVKGLSRDGKYVLYFKDEYAMAYGYVLLNSSFAYWYWRVYDGGILYPLSLLHSIPINFEDITDSDKEILVKTMETFVLKEEKYKVYKKNSNKIQENLKFDNKSRLYFNEVIGNILGFEEEIDFGVVHSSSFFKVSEKGVFGCE